MWDVVVMGGRVLISVVVLAVGLGSALGEDWPGFHGPRRDNRSSETGLLKEWPEGGPGWKPDQQSPNLEKDCPPPRNAVAAGGVQAGGRKALRHADPV